MLHMLSLLNFQYDGIHVLDVIQVAENEGRFLVEATRDDVLSVLVCQSVTLP